MCTGTLETNSFSILQKRSQKQYLKKQGNIVTSKKKIKSETGVSNLSKSNSIQYHLMRIFKKNSTIKELHEFLFNNQN